MELLASQAIQAAIDGGVKIATAESCTGGWIAQELTGVEGSSIGFESGVVTYSVAAKCGLLKVDRDMIERKGIVSPAVAAAMADGCLQLFPGAEVAVSVTGFAGPTAGDKAVDPPLGTVVIAWKRRGGECVTETARFEGDRNAVRAQAVSMALRGLADFCVHAKRD